MRRWSWLALVGLTIAACSGSDFGKEGTGQAGSAAAGSPSGGTKSSTAGDTSGGRAGANSAGSQSQSGAAGNGGSAGANSGGSGSGGKAGNGGSAGHSAGAGGMVLCPPCAAPPAPDCVGSGPCGCGPYVCPSGGTASGEECGPVVCVPPLECCNPLMGICTKAGQVCLQ